MRVDNAPGFKPLKNDTELSLANIHLDFGRIHNKNKNPVVEKGIRELSSEILRAYPEGGPLSESQLAIVVNQLNSRIRNRGLSAWEILSQRNQYTGEQIEIDDLKLSEEQAQLRAANQAASAKHKAQGRPPAENAVVQKGSLVYIKSDKEKHKARDRFLVTDISKDSCTVQKFVKSQLRSQKYQLKLSEIYPVLPDTITLPGMIRDLDCGREIEGVDDDAQEECVTPDSCVQPPCTPPVDVFDTSCDRGSLRETVPVDTAESGVLNDECDVGDAVEGDSVVCDSVDIVTPGSGVDAGVAAEPVDVDLNAARSQRKRAKPGWMMSGDFVMGK